LTATCGFGVTHVVDGYIFRYSDKHMRGIVTGTWTGPTGRSFTQTNPQNLILRKLPDGTLVYSISGQIGITTTATGSSRSPTRLCCSPSVTTYHLLFTVTTFRHSLPVCTSGLNSVFVISRAGTIVPGGVSKLRR
jgi:hypothetical protein